MLVTRADAVVKQTVTMYVRRHFLRRRPGESSQRRLPVCLPFFLAVGVGVRGERCNIVTRMKSERRIAVWCFRSLP